MPLVLMKCLKNSKPLMAYYKIILGYILVLLIPVSAYCQTASAIFKSDHSFQVSVNYIAQHSNYNNNVAIYKLPAEKAYNIKISFENDTVFTQKNIHLIDQGLTHIYEVTKEAIQLKKVIPTSSYLNPDNQLTIAYIENSSLISEVNKKDSVKAKDTAYVVPFDSYYKLEDYNGRIGCPFPLKIEEASKLRGFILAETLEESKLEKAKITIQEMDSACVLIDQIKELTLLFEYEETRLDFIQFIRPYAFDIDNYEKLYPVFDYDNSKDELKLLYRKKEK